jgi:hypothetical protein
MRIPSLFVIYVQIGNRTLIYINAMKSGLQRMLVVGRMTRPAAGSINGIPYGYSARSR